MIPNTVISEQDAVRRLVQRLGLGPRPGAEGFEATLASLTTPTPELGSPAPKLRKKTAPIEQRKAQRRQLAVQGRQLGIWWLDRIAAVDTPFAERMTWFWHTHFATSIQKVKSPH